MVSPAASRSPGAPTPTRRTKFSLRRCLCLVLCLACCLFLLLLIASISIHELEAQQRLQQQAPWEALEPASLSQLRPSRLREEINSAASNSRKAPDGYFNGFPVYLHQDQSTEGEQEGQDTSDATTTPHSSVHCIGENYEEDAWLERSCHFHMLCYDLKQKDFVLFRSHREEVLSRFLEARPGIGASSAMIPFPNATTGVALGGIIQKWQLPTNDPPSSKSFKWFPRVLNATPGSMTYYALPSNTVMIPYHSLSAKNPGHLVWDDFLPIYTLLTMFQLQNRVLLPLRVTLPQRLWASCEMSFDNELACDKMTRKFAALLVGRHYPYNITTANEARFELAGGSNAKRQSNYVCAPRGAAGLGSLTDHGTRKLHGWMRKDYKTTHNHGRGALLYEFRNFMLQNLGLPIHTASQSNPPYRVVFSIASSDIKTRNMDFEKQILEVQQNFSPDLVQVEAHIMKDLTVTQQVQLASETAIFITICGGGAVTGMFLPKGASVILYYLEHGGVEYGILTGSHAHLDWDLFNHLSHVRTHWMPTATMDNRVDLRALILLIQQELELIQNDILL